MAEQTYQTHCGMFDSNGMPDPKQIEFLVQLGRAQAKIAREIKAEEFTDYRYLQDVLRKGK